MLVLACLASLLAVQSAPAALLDVSGLQIGSPILVTEVDMGKLKGEPRRLAWAPDGRALYVQTGEGNPPAERLRHYSIAVEGGGVTALDEEPEWAARFWTMKQDRTAPGLSSLVIEIDQREESIKSGMAPAGALDRTGSPEAAAGTISPDAGHGNQKAHVVRLSLLGQVIAAWTNERVIPGARFGWGPAGSGAMVFVGEGGRLVLFDRQKRMQTLSGVKDALLPAWSADGERIAYLAKTGRKKFVLAYVRVAR